MQDFFRSRGGLAASAAAVILCIMVFFLATSSSWRVLLNHASAPLPPAQSSAPPGVAANPQPSAGSQPGVTAPSGESSSSSGAGAPAEPPAQRPTAAASASAQGQLPPAVPASGSPAPDAAAPSAASSKPEAQADGGSTKPSFDIVRVEPTGDSVIAARGSPNADVVLLDGGKAIAQAKADASGQVALLPPALKPGEHNLALSMKLPGATDSVSSQSVVVSVPDQPKTAPMVALIQPNQPAAILSGPVAGSSPAGTTPGPPSKPVTRPAPPSVVIRSVEVETMGSFYASGKAAPGSLSRVYLNGASVAAVTADAKGLWSLKINKGMKPGHYAVRVDQVDPSGGVVARAEVPFDYPAQVASSAPRIDLAKKNTGGQPPGGRSSSNLPSVRPPFSISTQSSPSPSVSAQSNPSPGNPSPSSPSPSGPSPSGPSPSSSSAGRPASNGPAVPNENSTASAANGNDLASAGITAPAGRPAPPNSGTPPLSAAPRAGGAATSGTSASNAAAVPPKSKNLASMNPATQPQPAISDPQSSAEASAPRTQAEAGASDDMAVEPTVIAELVTAKVVRGDSLWRISRAMLGHGVRYTQIYSANTQQIRDPRLIYPGQVFVLPQQ